MPSFSLHIIEDFIIQKPDIMKKTIFAILLLVGMATQGQAQEKGRLWIGGSIGFSSGDTDVVYIDNDAETSQKSNSYSIQPELGYAFSNHWAVGIRLGVGLGKTSSSQWADELERKSERKSKDFEIAPFVRYTCLNWRRINVFVDGGLVYRRYSDNNEEGDYENHFTANRFGIFVQPGFSFRLSPCIALTGRMDFFNAYYEKGETDKTTYSDRDTKQIYADLNSPFNLGKFTVGLNFSF